MVYKTQFPKPKWIPRTYSLLDSKNKQIHPNLTTSYITPGKNKQITNFNQLRSSLKKRIFSSTYEQKR